MRKLSSEELYHGIFVQSKANASINTHPDVYKILIIEGKTFYTVEGANWEMNGDLVKDNWYETELTKSLNKKDIRDKKLKELGI
jgi:translation initiation factor RLI1